MNPHTVIADEVNSALRSRRPVVALESTVIAHGLPYPSNVETALAVEAIIRESGAIPATIAVLDGVIHIGLSSKELERLSTGSNVLKLGTRDLPLAVSSKADGATTVSATAFIASRAGIRVFATGGIGGVHRGARETFDVSSDLWELTKSRLIIVSAGAKAILDLPATLEWLEMHQVPVVGYRADDFPGFYSQRTGLKIDRAGSVGEIVERFTIGGELGMTGGMLVAVPVPEEHEINAAEAIAHALDETSARGITGKEVTPWLLARLDELTDGKSVVANIALLKNNARVAAEISCAIADTDRA